MNFAAKRGLCEYRQIERPTQPKGRVRWLTPDEAERLIAACSPHLRPLVIFLLYTGARLSEALYLDWRQVDLDTGRRQFLETKNGETARRPAAPARRRGAVGAAAPRWRSVSTTPGRQAIRAQVDGGGQIKTAFRGACRRARIRLSPHDCGTPGRRGTTPRTAT